MALEAIQRLVKLWESRMEAAKAKGSSEELRAFSWWFFTSYFDDGWAIENLHAALKLTSGHLEMIMDSLGRLTGLAEKYPMLAVECTQMICDAAPDYVDLWSLDLSSILAAALESSEPAARLAARNFIEDLGTKGRLEYRNLLKLDPSVTGTDSAAPKHGNKD